VRQVSGLSPLVCLTASLTVALEAPRRGVPATDVGHARDGTYSTVVGSKHLSRSIAVVVAAALATGAGIGVARGARAGGRPCEPFSVVSATGTYAYVVRIEAGAVTCGRARAVLEAAAGWPGPVGWACRVGTGSEPWGISCTRAGDLIRAYGPTLVRAAPTTAAPDPWEVEAQKLGRFLYEPLFSAGLRLTGIELLPPCNGIKFTIVAYYGTTGGTTLTVAEGEPGTCGQLGAPPRLANWWIHGHPASLSEFCAPTGCARLSGEYALDWREQGHEITLMTHNFGQHELLAVARSLSRVP
jgi:hypothetical protein